MASRHPEQNLVRILVAADLACALLASALAPIPSDIDGHSALPAIALGQAGLYRVEVALLIFYSGLLLLTPTFSGIVKGRLPVEVSARGAKFAEDADQSADITQEAIERLERAAELHWREFAAVEIKVERLEAATERDTTQPEVNSGR
jgi:hypothetical protein